MTQRLGLALALVNWPDLVLLDEPTSALDPVGRREVRELVRELAAAGVTVFLNSHLLTEVEAVCDRWPSSATAGSWPAARWTTWPGP